ncbi:hypothetical protein [Microbacterium sp. R1]|uniref:hypothetical protein n=1 Tax=Microbacterium sp. R1 TaxID=322686 RepID=UPI0011C86D88|nr:MULTISPECIES: hypothetical protein [Terrabacteria group]TXF80795.1 hypothetical protein FTX54_16360 [Alkalicoccus halolimnae]
MTRPLPFRDEPPLSPGDYVVRGGAFERAPTLQSFERCLKVHGVAAISVAASAGGQPNEIVTMSPILRRIENHSWSTVQRLNDAGFELVATGKKPHYTLLLPSDDLDDSWDHLVRVFNSL